MARDMVKPMRYARRHGRHAGQQGFTYLIALFLVAILSVATLSALEKTITKDRRDKEAQLLYVGQAYRTAIMQYYLNSPGTAKFFPTDLSTLAQQDVRLTTRPRYLRRLYFDPMTGSSNWGTVTAPDGGIAGVYSLATQQPIKIAGFPPELSNFLGAQTYQQWQFIYLPQ
jgi:type II secretory pathway pseudopilin PulG